MVSFDELDKRAFALFSNEEYRAVKDAMFKLKDDMAQCDFLEIYTQLSSVDKAVSEHGLRMVNLLGKGELFEGLDLPGQIKKGIKFKEDFIKLTGAKLNNKCDCKLRIGSL